jgi:hypothetical protein
MISSMSRSGGCALGAASAFLADGRGSRDGTVGGDFFKRARSLTANRGNFAAFKQRGGHRQLPISAPGPAGFMSRFDALIAIIDYSGSCSFGRVLVDGHEVGHDLRTLPLATLQGCQEEKLARQGNRQGVRIIQRQRHCNRPFLGGRSSASGSRSGRREGQPTSLPVWSFLLHALPQILPQCSIGHGNPRPDLGAAVVQFGPLKVAHGGSGMETGRLPTAAEPGRTQRSRSRFSRCYSFIWFAGWRVGRQSRQQWGELPNQRRFGTRSNPLREVERLSSPLGLTLELAP